MTRKLFSRTASAVLALALLGATSALAQTPTPTVSPSPTASPSPTVSPSPSPTASPTPPTFTKVIVFGDSLSDVGNVRDRMEDKGFNYPGGEYNYSDGRFTNSSDTDPGSERYVGVWHEQLAREFLSLQEATHSQDGGNSFAFGGATTRNGTRDFSIIGLFGNDITVTIDNMGKQVDDYLATRVVDPNALYIVWGGGNDLFDDDSDSNVTATAGRMAMLVTRLANAGARNFLVPNVPPLGAVPRYEDQRELQDKKNTASADYRARLEADLDAAVDALASQGVTNTVIYRMDTWGLFVRFLISPARYGFTDPRNSARGEDVDVDEYAFWDDIHPTTAAHFQLAKQATRLMSGGVAPTGRALNVATRVRVGSGDNVGIGGFIVSGSEPKRVILRGIGPSLAAQNVPGPLIDPVIELFDASSTSLGTNDNWRQNQQVEIIASGLAPTNEAESALIATLPPGDYTVVLSGKNGGVGVGLVEIYDLDSSADSTLANLSTRGVIGTGDDVMIGGVIVGAGEDPIVVVRAIGPSLASAAVPNALQDPVLELYDNNGVIIAQNDNWGTETGQRLAAKTTLLVPDDDRESVIVADLAEGNYTAIVRGKNNTTGIGLVEVYRIRDIATR
jgi:phospholipase/lecithinase/hemolysin